MNNPKFIKIIYSDEIWYARLEDNYRYVSDGLMYSSKEGNLIVAVTSSCSMKDVLDDEDFKPIEITEKEYWQNIYNQLDKEFEEKINELKNEINEINNVREKLKEKCI